MDLDRKVCQLLERDATFRQHRRYQLMAFFIRRVLGGIQYSIIIPTGWAYAKSFGEQPWFMGILVGAYHLTGILALPLSGHIFDHYKMTKEIVIISNCFEMFGSLLYALPYSQWLLLTGRLVAGLGGAFLGIMSSEIAWITTKHERLAIYARMELGNLLGLLLGPALAFSFKWIDFKIGDWHIQSTNVPGVVCFLGWLVLQVLSVFMVHNLAHRVALEINDKSELAEGSIDDASDKQPLVLELTSEINSKLNSTSETDDFHHEVASFGQATGDTSPKYSLKRVAKELTVFEVMFVFVTSFLVWVFLACADVIIPLYTQEDFGWSPASSSLTFLVISIEAALVFAIMNYASGKVSDLNLVMLGICCNILQALFWDFYSWQRKNYRAAVSLFCFAIFTGVIGFATFQVASKSLLSKILSPEIQGAMQSSTAILYKVAYMLGPVVGSFIFSNVLVSNTAFGAALIVCLIWGSFSRELLDK